MSGSKYVKPWFFAVFSVIFTILGSFEACLGAEGCQSLNVARDKEKTVYIIESPRSEDNQDNTKAWDMLQNLRIDSWRGEDGKRPDSDRRGRGEHP
jgi:hypothetical protein